MSVCTDAAGQQTKEEIDRYENIILYFNEPLGGTCIERAWGDIKEWTELNCDAFHMQQWLFKDFHIYSWQIEGMDASPCSQTSA